MGKLKPVLACSDVLSTEDIINFLGMNQSLEYNSKRLVMYKHIIELQLLHHVAKLICKDLMYKIEMGIAQFGSKMNSFRYIQRELHNMGFSLQDIWNGNVDMNKFQQACDSGIGMPQELAKAAFLDDSLPKM